MTRSRWALVGAAIYGAFLTAAPFTHHDLACELKNPQHCTACTSNVLGADPSPSSTTDGGQLADAGSATSEHVIARDLLLVVRTTGRSPPADT